MKKRTLEIEKSNSAKKNKNQKINPVILGKGASGKVIKVSIKSFSYAYKEFNKEKEKEHEINLIKGIKHENIISFFKEFKDGFLMDLADNTLFQLVTETQLDLRKEIDLALQFSKGLEFLHQNNILHGDLKPQNILIKNNKVKIADFGFSVKMIENQISGYTKGSYRYVSPEIASKQIATLMSDIYSLSMVFVFIAKRAEPYSDYLTEEELGNKWVELLKRVCYEFERPSIDETNIHSEFKSIIKECWSDVPKNRPIISGVVNRLDELFKIL